MYRSALTRCLFCRKPLQNVGVIRYSQNSESPKQSPFVAYLRSLKWVPIPLTVGFAYIGYQQYGHIVKREERSIQNARSPEDLVAKEWQVSLYRALPLKALSRLWGRTNDLRLPEWLRSPVLRSYIWMFGCQLEEAAIRDLKHYKNLGEFFRRRLKPDCRPVDTGSPLVCPSDGKILHFGRVERGLIEQVKGVTYTMQGFLGSGPEDNSKRSSNDEQYHENVLMNADHELYHCVIYLAPGDYHGFHSPAQWDVAHRRHFPGDLLSVNPGIARWVKGLFNLNERAVYIGKWEHGFFSMTAVGATNVGSIRVYHDQSLRTNVAGRTPADTCHEFSFMATDRPGIPMKKGESFGEFNLGSTIVLVFEAPKSFQFDVKEGQVIKFGGPLGRCDPKK